MNSNPTRAGVPGDSWKAVNLLDFVREQDEADARLREYGRQYNDLDEILTQHGSWVVTEYGLEHLGTGSYAIPKERVHEPDWALHMAEKQWVNMHDFLLALGDARWRWPAPTPRQRAARPTPAKETKRRISQRKRFSILQRDGFACQLCGRSAEQDHVKLHVDHQQPVSKGGDDSDENLWTLCSDCNLGKSDTT